MKSADPRLQRIVEFFEHLSAADLPRLAEIYTPDARFKDPFNDVRGVAAIERIFGHMFVAFETPRFAVHDTLAHGGQCFLTWELRFRQRRLGPGEQCIRGASHLLLAEDGRVATHRDYWDAAEELYEKVPWVGGLMRWLKRRVNG